MRENKLLNRCEKLTVSLGAAGLILIALGGSACFLGVSSKAVQKLALFLKPHQAATQKMVNYGAGLTYMGLFFTGSGVLIAKTLGEYLADKEFAEEINSNLLNQKIVEVTQEIGSILSNQELNVENKQCSNCAYFSSNSLLSCAVNPDLPNDCSDFLPK
ncbi:MAG TPA: hypothetical protein VE944_28920 [Nostoc sp.]|uniref:hypothetical protein n=1 Tax=Nostoc sp. TaxID=1180 RepID=UPI002D376CF4|nr:hypothetical protein [Nostoc sp.]HYX18317.1 hypothetical protein [Nostoc sp.]